MAYTEDQLKAIAAKLADTYKVAEEHLIGYVLDADLTNYNRMRAAEQLQQVQAELRRLRIETRIWSEENLAQLYRDGMKDIYDALDEDLPSMTALHTESIQVYVENMDERMDDALIKVGRRVNDVFRQAGLNSLQTGTVLGETVQETTRRMVKELRDKGMVCYKDVLGREHTLKEYAEMVIRTGEMEAMNGGVVNTAAELELTLVEVSSHSDPCPKCAPWEGKILSIVENDEGIPTLAEAKAAGLFHPNCLHSIAVVVPDDEDEEA